MSYWKSVDNTVCKSKILKHQFKNKDGDIMCANTTLDSDKFGYGVAMKSKDKQFVIKNVYSKQQNENDWHIFKMGNFCKNNQ